MENNNPDVMGPLNKLIAEARAQGKWLWCHYQDLWFSPDQLEAENRAGRFRWGAVNWKLRNPKERLEEANSKLEKLQSERDRIARDIS